jgi:hypothetical protein
MLDHVLWPQTQLLNGTRRLAETLGVELRISHTNIQNLEQYADSLGVEALPTQTLYGDLQHTLSRLIPGVVKVNHLGEPAYVFISGKHRNQLRLLLPEGGSCLCDLARVVEFIREDRGHHLSASIEKALGDVGLQAKRLARARQLLIHQQWASCAIESLWLLRPHASRGLKAAVMHARLGHFALGFVMARLLERVALLGGVSLLGYVITQGHWTTGIIVTWLLIMLSHWALSALGQACRMQLDVRLGLIIKRQLQHSALRLTPEAHAEKGPAQFLGQAMEADGLQNNTLPGVFAAANALMDMLFALGIALFIQQWLMSGLIIIFMVVSSYPVVQFGRAYRVWAKRRTKLSHLTLEHMQGNRTRLMQSDPSRWHRKEELQLHHYWLASERMDKFAFWLQAVIPSAWLISASAILCVAIMFSILTITQLATLIGIILLVWQAWHLMADSCQQLACSWHSWQEIQDLLKHNAASYAPSVHEPKNRS